MDIACSSLFETDADLITLIIILAYFAFLGTIILIIYFSRNQRQVLTSTTLQPLQTKQTEKTEKTKQPESNAPKQFKHIMIVPSFDKAKLIVEQLQEKGRRYTLEGNEDGLITLHYVSPKKANLEKLKRKGIILDGKIQEVKEETSHV